MSKGDHRRPEAQRGAFDAQTPFRVPRADACPYCGSKSSRVIIKPHARTRQVCSRCGKERPDR